jgi:hypothetical protein
MKPAATLLLICALTICACCACAQHDAMPAGVMISGNDFVSQDLPKLRVKLDPKLKYIGSFPFDVDGISGGYRFVWGEVDTVSI